MADDISVEVAVAWPDQQALVTVTLARGSTAADAIRASGIEETFAGRLDPAFPIGVWGHPVARDHVVEDGDRIEIYRPLEADPREARRRLAAEGKTMGRPGGGGRDEALRDRR